MQSAHALFVGHDDEAAQAVREAFDRRKIALRQRNGTLEAMRHIDDNAVTAIIVDFEMPDGGALALKEHADSVSKDCPVVLIVPDNVEPEWLLLFDCFELERPVTIDAVEALMDQLELGVHYGATHKDHPAPAPQSRTSTAPYVIPQARDDTGSQPVNDAKLEYALPEAAPDFERRASLPSFLKSRPSMFYRAVPPKKHKDSIPLSLRSVSGVSTRVPPGGSTKRADAEASAAPKERNRSSLKDIRRTTATTADHAVYARVDTKVRTNFDLKGKLELVALPTIFWKLFANRMSGILKLSDGERSIYVKGGVPVFVSSQVLSESFPQYLSRRGWVKAAEVDRVNQSLQPGETLPEALVREHILSDDSVTHALKDWLHSTLLHCFHAKTGSYRFHRGRDWLGSVLEHAFNPIQLIAEALYQTLDPNELAAELEDLLDMFPVKTEKYFEFLRFFPANRQEWEWIEAIDGTRTVSELTLVAAGNIVGLLTLVYSLKAADIIDFSDQPRQLPGRSTDRSDPRIREGYLTRANLVVGGAEEGVLLPSTTVAADSSSEPREQVDDSVAETESENGGETSGEESDEGGDAVMELSSTTSSPALEPKPTAAAAAAPVPSGGVSDLEVALAEYVERASYQDPYYLLDVPRTASTADVALGYQKFLARLPQGRFEELSPAAKQNAFRVHEEVQQAFNSIAVALLKGEFSVHRDRSDHQMGAKHKQAQIESLRRSSMLGKERAKAVEEKRGSPVARIQLAAGEKTEQGYAEAYYKEAERLVNQENWFDAMRVIKEAVELVPNSSQVVALEAWIAFHQATAKPDRKMAYCADKLLEAVTLSTENADAYFYLGIVRKAQKMLPEALAAFEEALRIDPDASHRSLRHEITALRGRGVQPKTK